MIAVYVFGAILALLLASVILSAFLDRPSGPQGRRASTPRERQEAALEALREIEFEYRTGKLMEEDYLELRDRWAGEALAARDELRGSLREVEGEREGEEGAAVVPGASGPKGAAGGPTGEPATAAGGDAAACPSCGARPPRTARFCPRCGARLEPESARG